MNKLHKRRLIIALLTLLVVFVLVFFAGLYNYLAGQKSLAIGLSASAQNMIIMIFSVLSLLNIVIELHKVN
ncbi:hypothetical protein K9M74_04740 [Candidatus Woesearchaeota archaeon]|nr:hypothetical protein [Candidatus Woesearchaeota archaeon]